MRTAPWPTCRATLPAEREAFEVRGVSGRILPFPRQPGINERHVGAEEVQTLRDDREWREPAVADKLRRDALAEHRLGAREPRQGEVGVGVQVNESGSQDRAVDLKRAPGGGASDVTDCGNPVLLDADIGAEPRIAGSVDNARVAEEKVERLGKSPGLI